MRYAILITALVATPAMAQLVGGGLSAGAGVGVQPGAVGTAVGGVTGALGQAATDTGRVAAGTARDVADGNVVRVKAGARVRATRETRCYDGADYYDPAYYPDRGTYYCESRGAGVAAGARVRAGG